MRSNSRHQVLVEVYKEKASPPLPLEYPVKSMDDRLRLKSHYAFSEDRIGAGVEERVRELVEAGRVVTSRAASGSRASSWARPTTSSRSWCTT